MRTALIVTLGTLLAVPTPAMAQPAPKRGDDKKDDKKSRGPGFSIETKRKERPKDTTQASIQASIDNQRQIIDLTDKNDPQYADMVIELADYYWDYSEQFDRLAHSEELEEEIFQAEERNDAAALAKAKAKQQALFDKQRAFQNQTIEKYYEVIADHPNAKNIDELRYYLGYHLNLMKRHQESTEVYTQLILNNPTSPYVPDALVNIGEYLFSENDFTNALKLYKQVEQYPDAPIYGYSVYKQAWCMYNMGEYDRSLSQFLGVLKLSFELEKKGQKSAVDLRKEAQGDMVLPYAKAGKPSAAIRFFKKYAPDRYLDLAMKLSAIYTEETEYNKSNKLLRELIKLARKVKIKGESQHHLVIRFQRLIVANEHAQADKKATVAEIQTLIRLFEEIRGTAPPKFIKKETESVGQMMMDIAFGYQEEYKSTKAKATLVATQLLYDEYLRLFGDKPNAYDITYNNAILMMTTEKWAEAAVEFEKVIKLQPNGKYADDAAERAVVAHLKSIKVKTPEKKSTETSDLKRQELTTEHRLFVAAVDRWLALIKRRGGPSEETKQNLPKARYLAALFHYEANQFDEAAKRFEEYLTKHPNHDYIVDAARMMLSAYNLAHDVDNLQKYVDKFDKDPRFQGTEVIEDITIVRKEFDFQKCFRFEKKEQFLGAASCFLSYEKRFPDSTKAPHAVYNAAVNYFNAKKVEDAIKTQQLLYEKYKADPLGPKALYAIGEIFRETTVYDQAAYIYEVFVQNHKNHDLAEKALRYASIFRKTLGEYNKAVDNLHLYLKRYPKNENAPRVHLDIIKIRQQQNKPTRAIKLVKKHLRAYKRESPGTRLQVLTELGKAHQTLGKYNKANKAFAQTVEYFKTIPNEELPKLNMAAVSAVAEAHFYLGDSELKRARRITLEGKNEKAVQGALQEKLELLKAVNDTYQTVISYGHPGWTIAAYTQLGLAYADLADNVENTEVPRSIKHIPEAVDEYLSFMAQKAQAIREKAIVAYGEALKIAREKHWFNEYSEKAETAIARLDFNDRSVKEFRLRPTHTAPNSGVPQFKADQL